MSFIVYKSTIQGRRFKNWEFSSEHENLDDAEAAARDLCPKNEEIETEPGSGLERAFFGSVLSLNWSARISRKPSQ